MRTSGAGLVGMTLFCVYACAKATDSDLGGGYLPRAGRGGSGAKPGASVGGTGGSTTGGTAGRGGSSGGKAGTGTGGTSSGGTGANAGGTSSGAGGSGNATSTGGTDATGGTLNQGGQAGDDGVPPDVLANAKVVLLYVNQQTATLSTQPQMRLYLMNQSDTALDLVHVVVRYWMTAETSAFSLKSYYAASAVSKLALAYVDAADESRIEVTFSSGSIPSHNTDKNAVEFQVALLGDNGATVEQSNDWSFDPTLTGEPQPNDKITVYLAEKLVWGCEPSGKCAGEDGAGGAGGQGGQGGEPGTGGTSPTGGAGGTSGTGVGGAGGQGGEPSAGQGGA